MAKLFPWDPWMELECMKEDMKRLVEDFSCPSPFAPSPKRVAQFRPVADMIESEHEFQILVELPGLEREDVSLEVRGEELVVFGERRLERDASGVTFQVMERSYGCFARRFSFPMSVEDKDIRASMKAGLLVVVVSKALPEPARKHISIRVNE